MNRGARFAIALAGLVATPIYWALVLFKVFVLVMAECGPGPGCITSGQRSLWLAGLLVGGTAIYGVGVSVWRRLDVKLSGQKRAAVPDGG